MRKEKRDAERDKTQFGFALLVLTIVTMPFGVANAGNTDLAGIWAGALELPEPN